MRKEFWKRFGTKYDFTENLQINYLVMIFSLFFRCYDTSVKKLKDNRKTIRKEEKNYEKQINKSVGVGWRMCIYNG